MHDDLTAAVLERLPDDSPILALPDPAGAVAQVLATAQALGAVHDSATRDVTIPEMCTHLAELSGKPRYADPPTGYGPGGVIASSADLTIVTRAALATVSGDPVEMSIVGQYAAALRQYMVAQGVR